MKCTSRERGGGKKASRMRGARVASVARRGLVGQARLCPLHPCSPRATHPLATPPTPAHVHQPEYVHPHVLRELLRPLRRRAAAARRAETPAGDLEARPAPGQRDAAVRVLPGGTDAVARARGLCAPGVRVGGGPVDGAIATTHAAATSGQVGSKPCDRSRGHRAFEGRFSRWSACIHLQPPDHPPRALPLLSTTTKITQKQRHGTDAPLGFFVVRGMSAMNERSSHRPF